MNLSVLTNRQNLSVVDSCQLNCRIIKSKFVSEFVGPDKPAKFVSCQFVSSCQLNPSLIKLKVVSEFVGTDKPTEILHFVCQNEDLYLKVEWKLEPYDSEKHKTLDTEGAIESFPVKQIDFT